MLCVVIDGRKCEWVSAMLGAIDDWSSHAGGCISTRVNKPEQVCPQEILPPEK